MNGFVTVGGIPFEKAVVTHDMIVAAKDACPTVPAETIRRIIQVALEVDRDEMTARFVRECERDGEPWSIRGWEG